MKQSEFKKWLSDQGATFGKGKRHEKVYLNGKQSVIPRHGSKELATGTMEAIKKQLGLD